MIDYSGFRQNFNIEFTPVDILNTWNSNLVSTATLREVFNHARNATINNWGGRDILAFFTSHGNITGGGFADAVLGRRLIVGADRNIINTTIEELFILRHELNHIMGCTCNFMTVANGFNPPVSYHPFACFQSDWQIIRNHWCSHCVSDINANRNRTFVWIPPTTVTPVPCRIS